jgi:hypothetical protein
LNGFVDSCSWLNKNELRILVEIVMKENSTKFELTKSEQKCVRVADDRLLVNILSNDLQLLFLKSEKR